MSPRLVRIGKWVALACWLLIAIVSVPLSGRLEAALTNDDTAFLPATAESTRVITEQQRFPGGQSLSTVLAYVRDNGLTSQDLAAVEATRQRLLSARLVESAAPPVTRSRDGRAALVTVSVPEPNDPVQLQKSLSQVRTTARAGLPTGLEVSVTGPGGAARDLAAVGESIDSTLLTVTVIVVALILLLTYRSPVLWLAPLFAVGIAATAARASVYLLARAGLVVNQQSASILTVLVFGVATDYALLLIARYREELRHYADRHAAMAEALRRVAPAILASGTTVAVSLLCLLVSAMNSNRGLGPVGAVGLVAAFAAMLTLLPALLVLCGRWLFWPFIPRPYLVDEPVVTDVGNDASRGWTWVAAAVSRRPRRIWVATSLALAALTLGLADLNTGLTAQQAFAGRPESVVGQEIVTRHFPAGSSAPALVIADTPAASVVEATASASPGVISVVRLGSYAGRTQLAATLTEPDGPIAYAAVTALRDRLHAVPGARAVVGGQAAASLDVRRATDHDRRLVIPLVLLVVLAFLVLLLRAVLAPVLLVATVVLSYLAALGASALIYRHVLGLPGTDASVPLFGFIFLVALGVDYNIFLMSRVREESGRHGTRTGVLRGLVATGGVITSAGVVLAAVFAVLAVLPIVLFIEIGVVVALGVLIDTFIVRSLLVPALALDLGRRVWWPSKWDQTARRAPQETQRRGVYAD